MVAVNYVGEELWSFYNAPWEKRVDLARQLMDIAEQLTNNDFEFALYLLDVSFDNFAVGPRDGKVIVVDAENVLVADKRLIKQSKWRRLSLPEHIRSVRVGVYPYVGESFPVQPIPPVAMTIPCCLRICMCITSFKHCHLRGYIRREVPFVYTGTPK